MEDVEVRTRCIEAASKNPSPHPEGYTAGVLEAAQQWFMWIKGGSKPLAPPINNNTLGLPKKKA